MYAVGCPQPLVKFALTSGSYSDPVVKSHPIILIDLLKITVSTWLTLRKSRPWHNWSLPEESVSPNQLKCSAGSGIHTEEADARTWDGKTGVFAD